MVIFFIRRGANNYLRLVFGFIFLLFNLFVFAQNKQASIWHVGNKKLDFNTTPITITDIVSPFLGTFSSIALADINGKYLLFASAETRQLYDNNYSAITEGVMVSVIQFRNIIYIPKPGSKNLIYCFFRNKYSLIDTQNNTVTENNIIWTQPELTNMYAVHHVNCNDIWLIAQHSDGFYSYLVSNSGVSVSPLLTPAKNFTVCRGTFSSSGKYFAIPNSTTSRKDTVLINFGEFNRQTGQLTIKNSGKYKDYNACVASAFSADGTKLYLLMRIRNTSTTHLYQVNIIDGTPDFNSGIIISSQPIGGFIVTSMQLGLDGKIYLTQYLGANKINIIHNPNILGIGCSYEDNAIPLTTSGANLPIFIDTWFSNNYCKLDFVSENYCLSDNTVFTLTNFNGVQSVRWDFGDGQTSAAINPTHAYTNAGTYTVTLEVTLSDNTSQTITKTIEIFNKPSNFLIEHD